MIFVDYFFTKLPGGSIMFDEELEASKLEIEHGDKFIAEVKNGKLFLRKITDDRDTKQTVE